MSCFREIEIQLYCIISSKPWLYFLTVQFPLSYRNTMVAQQSHELQLCARHAVIGLYWKWFTNLKLKLALSIFRGQPIALQKTQNSTQQHQHKVYTQIILSFLSTLLAWAFLMTCIKAQRTPADHASEVKSWYTRLVWLCKQSAADERTWLTHIRRSFQINVQLSKARSWGCKQSYKLVSSQTAEKTV